VVLTDRPQNLWPSAQGSPNSLSSTPTPTRTHIHKVHAVWKKQQGDIHLAQLKPHVLQYQNWSVRVKRSQISAHLRLYIWLSPLLLQSVGAGDPGVVSGDLMRDGGNGR